MASNPQKKTENAADAPPSSGASTTASTPAPDAKAQGAVPTARELELQAQLEDLRGEVEFLRQERGPDLGDAKLQSLISKLGEAIGVGVANALAAEREAQRTPRKLAKRVVPPEFMGPHTYIVGPKGAYKDGRRYVAGEKITIVDQFPASDWKPVESNVETPAKAPAQKTGRASDQTVG